MIVGLGTDMIEIARSSRAWTGLASGFCQRVYTTGGDCLLPPEEESSRELCGAVCGEGGGGQGARNRHQPRR